MRDVTLLKTVLCLDYLETIVDGCEHYPADRLIDGVNIVDMLIAQWDKLLEVWDTVPTDDYYEPMFNRCEELHNRFNDVIESKMIELYGEGKMGELL